MNAYQGTVLIATKISLQAENDKAAANLLRETAARISNMRTPVLLEVRRIDEMPQPEPQQESA